ncbi:Gfo/Idh/MocA family protein [Paenibacillus barengoltzii]|uniref:Gfo/Idh/MocA family protein n=1 Tax=Paenibacillus barengoltzii TaxID=343517 RepID=UPI000FDBB959|nr:Gfo/Idh/MocA family oxidoreductase [Paenibacillus barengoltzii]
MRYRVALIGAGGIARHHLDAIRQLGPERLTAVAVAEPDESRGRAVAKEYALRWYDDYRKLIIQEQPDIAIIALPHHLHEDCAVFCAANGSHLLLEKPMALTSASCDVILNAVKEAGVTLMVGHTQHYLPANRQAKALIESGRLGKLVAIHDTRHKSYFEEDRPRWFLEKEKAGGGILMNLGAHSVDKIQWLTGSRITKVKAVLSYEAPIGNVEGSGVVLAATEDGLGAVIVQSGYPGVAKDETELIFTGGMARLVSHQGLWISRDGHYELTEDFKPEDVKEPFTAQLDDLLVAIEHRAEPECSGEYAKSVISVLEAVYRSQEEGAEQVVQ